MFRNYEDGVSVDWLDEQEGIIGRRGALLSGAKNILEICYGSLQSDDLKSVVLNLVEEIEKELENED